MINLPKILQTPADFELAESLATSGEISHAELARHYEGLLEGRYHYVFDHDLLAGAAPDGPMPDYCVTENQETGARQQLKRVDNLSARALDLGFTWLQIEQRISALQA